jgi:glycosyltransferase involved in cell wall biosynthesis
MRIVQALGWYFPDSLGGTEVYVAALASRLRARGHHVQVAAPEPGLDAARAYEHDHVPVYRYPISVHPSRAEARAQRTVRGAEQFHRWLSQEHPDVVHVHTFVTGLGIHEIEAARAAGARVIVTTHAASLGFVCERGTLLHLGERLCDGLVGTAKCSACALQQRGVPLVLANTLSHVPAAAASLARNLPGRVGTALAYPALIADNVRMQQRTYAAVSAFVVLSEWAANVLIANGAPADKVVVNRLGIRTLNGSPYRPPRAPGPVVAGFIGRAEPIKGLDVAVRAIRALDSGIDVRLHVIAPAASARERAFLAACRAAAGSDPRITFEDGVAPEQVGQRLAGIDLLLCPSRAVEGGPTIAIEALAAGVPVVGAALPALTEIVIDRVNGRLHPPGDAEALAAVLREVAADPSLVDRWRTTPYRARTMDDVAADYLELYAR